MRLLTALLSATCALSGSAGDGWIQLLPADEFAARDGRPGKGLKWRIDDALGQKIAANFSAVAALSEVVIDYDHQTLYVAKTGQKAPAAGWMSAAEWRPGRGLFAKTSWTPAAAKHIDDKEYRYISPVLLYEPKSLAVVGVSFAALVNHPALLGMEPVLAQLATQFQQEQDTMNPILAALLAGLGLAETATQEQAMTALNAVLALKTKPAVPVALATALNLQAGADEAAALAAVAALGKPDPVAATAMAALQTQLAELTAQINGDKVTKTVDDAITAGKLLPAQRDWALGLGKKDMAALSAYVASAPVIHLAGQTGGQPAPGGAPGGAPAADALATQVMTAFGLTPEQFAKGAPKTAA